MIELTSYREYNYDCLGSFRSIYIILYTSYLLVFALAESLNVYLMVILYTRGSTQIAD